MKKVIAGKAYVLGDNIDTDQIIPAEYLSYNPAIPEEREEFGRLALIGVPEHGAGLPKGSLPFVRPGAKRSEYKIVIGGKNFGCGSSREHAPLSLHVSGVEVVIAEFYARIFFRNSINGGYLVPFECEAGLNKVTHTGDELEVRIKEERLVNKTQKEEYKLKPLGDVLPILEAGDVFSYAKQAGFLK